MAKGVSLISAKDWAARKGVTVQVAYRQIKAHGIEPAAPGLYHLAALIEADRVGKQLDRAAVVKAGGRPSGNLQAAKLTAQVRKLDVEISILEAERDTALGKLVDIEKALATLCKIHGDLAGRITTWREASAAKRPELRREVDELAADLNARLAEDVTL